MERMLAASGCKFCHRVDRSVARPSDAALAINYFPWENTPSEESMCMLSMEEGLMFPIRSLYHILALFQIFYAVTAILSTKKKDTRLVVRDP